MNAIDGLLEQVRAAAADRRALCILGGNSKQHFGRESPGEPIHVGGYSGIVDYQPSELVITVRAGTTIAELQDVLAAEDQFLASEPPSFDGQATIGGTLACNLSGPSRPWLGSIRDHVLGVRIINGKGEHLRFGGEVMKNVAGYDVSRLMAGAMGTLGIVTEVTLKVVPRPEATLTVRRRLAATDALRTMNDIARMPLPVTGACWFDGGMYIRLAGAASAVDAAAGRIEGERIGEEAAPWQGLCELSLPFFTAAGELWCVSLRSTHDHFLPDEAWLLDWRGARRWLAAYCERQTLDRHVGDARGEAWQLRGASDGAEVFPDRSDSYRRTLLQLKQALDPGGIFNPGRLYSWM